MKGYELLRLVGCCWVRCLAALSRVADVESGKRDAVAPSPNEMVSIRQRLRHG